MFVSFGKLAAKTLLIKRNVKKYKDLKAFIFLFMNTFSSCVILSGSLIEG